MVIGVLGEYVGKILMALNNAPQFVIKKKMNTGKTNIVIAPDVDDEAKTAVYSENIM